MDKRPIILKYSIIAFIIALIPFSIILGILNSISHVNTYNQTIILAAIITAISNAFYMYFHLNKILQNKNQQ